MFHSNQSSIIRMIPLYVITLVTPILFQACDNDVIVGPISGTLNAYFMSDTDPGQNNEEYLVIDGEAQEITLSVIGTLYDIPFPDTLRPWVAIPDDSTPANFTTYHYNSDILTNDHIIPGTDIKLEVIEKNDKPAIRLTVPENDTDRDIWFYIFYGPDEPIIKNGEIVQGTIRVTQTAKTTAESFVVKARYKSRIYESEAVVNDDGSVEYSNPEYTQLMQQLDALSVVHTVVIDSNCMSYYDEEDIECNRLYNDIMNFNSAENSILTRATGFENHTDSDLGYFAIFDNDHFKGTSLIKGLSDFHFTYNIPSLKPYNLNDKVTSIAIGYYGTDPIVCSVLTIWDDTDYNHGDNNRSKHRISLMATQSSRQVSIPDLKKYKKIGSSKSWNDCISSISCHFGYIDRQLLNY